MTTSPPTSKSTPTTLLEALKSFQTLQKTRHNLIQELESSLSSYLIPSSTPSLPEPPATTNGERPSCASQALSLPTLQQLDQHLSSASSEDVQDPLTTIKIRPPNEFELTEILRIGFLGLLEINNELTMLELTLEETFKRADLGKIVGNVKGLEEERFRIVSIFFFYFFSGKEIELY